ncbi:hypothetical protein MKX03_035553 [Papaver bracteatum]|nr:hypothetical protein MKX03_035553 [Papaver bracteatum]
MGRRKIEIKYIKNTIKRPNELTILCDAQVCVIMFSSNGKLHEYVSPSTTMEDFFDMYQKQTNIDPSAGNVNLFQSLQKESSKQKKINSILREEIGLRTGQEDLSEFSYGELAEYVSPSTTVKQVVAEGDSGSFYLISFEIHLTAFLQEQMLGRNLLNCPCEGVFETPELGSPFQMCFAGGGKETVHVREFDPVAEFRNP